MDIFTLLRSRIDALSDFFNYFLQLRDTNGNKNRKLASILDSFQFTVKMKQVERAATRRLIV